MHKKLAQALILKDLTSLSQHWLNTRLDARLHPKSRGVNPINIFGTPSFRPEILIGIKQDFGEWLLNRLDNWRSLG